MSTLFKISEVMNMITEHLIESGGELTDEVEELLIITKDKLESKVMDYAYAIRSLEYDNDIVDVEIKRLQQIKKIRANTVDRLKTTVSNALVQFEVNEIKTPTCKVNFRASQSLTITDESSLAMKYKLKETVIKIDNKQIKADLKAGNEVKGAEITYKQNLQIK